MWVGWSVYVGNMRRLKEEDLIGKKVNKLTILSYVGKNGLKKDKHMYNCLCDCGKEKVIRGRFVLSGKVKSCTACNEIPIGSRFGQLTVVSVSNRYKSGSSYECLCECGKTKVLHGTLLRNGKARTCGCSKTKFIKIGARFSKLVVLERVVSDEWDCPKYRCKCDCGNECLRVYFELERKDGEKSCGCSRGKEFSFKREDVLSNRLFMDLNRRNIKKFGEPTSISLEEFRFLISQECFYCESEPLNKKSDTLTKKNFIIDGLNYNGLDRVNSRNGYHLQNVVTCCQWCNRYKKEKTLKEFFDRADKIYRFLSLYQDYDIYSRIKTWQTEAKILIKEIKPPSFEKVWRSYVDPSASTWVRFFRTYTKNSTVPIDFSWFVGMASLPCFYCNEKPAKRDNKNTNYFIYANGIDRICSNLSYQIENTVACCEECNKAKMHMSIDDFLQRTKRIVENKKARKFAGLPDFVL